MGVEFLIFYELFVKKFFSVQGQPRFVTRGWPLSTPSLSSPACELMDAPYHSLLLPTTHASASTAFTRHTSPERHPSSAAPRRRTPGCGSPPRLERKFLEPSRRARRRAQDVGAVLLGRRAAAERGRRRGRRGRRRGGHVRVAVEPGAARARVRRPVRVARVGVPRLPLRVPHPVRRSPPLPSALVASLLGEPIRFVT